MGCSDGGGSADQPEDLTGWRRATRAGLVRQRPFASRRPTRESAHQSRAGSRMVRASVVERCRPVGGGLAPQGE